MLSLSAKFQRSDFARHRTSADTQSKAKFGAPRLSQRHRRCMPVAMIRSQKAAYYFDASWHTGKTLRHLIRSLAFPEQPSAQAGVASAKELLAIYTDSLLWSICPGGTDDYESKAFFMALLDRHLSSLDAKELAQFREQLCNTQYDCYVTESVITDTMYVEHGFSNGPPQTTVRTLLTTPELHQTLDSLQLQAEDAEQSMAALDLPDALALALRDQLSAGAAQWADSQKTLQDLAGLAHALAALLGLHDDMALCLSRTQVSGASVVSWLEGRLLIHRDIADALNHDDTGKLIARVQRDLLENLLVRKYSGNVGDIRNASPAQRRQIWRVMAQIESCAPTLQLSETTRTLIRGLMASPGQLGRVQISPVTGAALGHSWIAPSLSLMPDLHQPKQLAGTRYMHSGSQPEARESLINEWPMRWLSTAESEQLYPAHAAWHQPVPVDALQLTLAAEALMRDWKAQGVRYRFADVSADKPATGCRISVWETVRRGMTPPLREVFDRYNQGLCMPDSGTELWERLRGFMGWLEKIISD